jgi:hypothetical protein
MAVISSARWVDSIPIILQHVPSYRWMVVALLNDIWLALLDYYTLIQILGPKSYHPRTNPLNPLDITPHRREILVPIFRDENHILDPDATNALVALQYLVVDMLRVPDWGEKVGREVDTWFNGLISELLAQSRIEEPVQLTTTIPSSNGNLSLK